LVLAVAVLVMLAAPRWLGGNQGSTMLDAAMRVVPAASKHRMDEQHRGRQAG
jgi:hypothetical protein